MSLYSSTLSTHCHQCLSSHQPSLLIVINVSQLIVSLYSLSLKSSTVSLLINSLYSLCLKSSTHCLSTHCLNSSTLSTQCLSSHQPSLLIVSLLTLSPHCLSSNQLYLLIDSLSSLYLLIDSLSSLSQLIDSLSSMSLKSSTPPSYSLAPPTSHLFRTWLPIVSRLVGLFFSRDELKSSLASRWTILESCWSKEYSVFYILRIYNKM